jgi:hypothetical protein
LEHVDGFVGKNVRWRAAHFGDRSRDFDASKSPTLVGVLDQIKIAP